MEMRDLYPSLSKLALDMLSIPASSCECERMFSELGDLLESRRGLKLQLAAAVQCVRRQRRADFGDASSSDDSNVTATPSNEDLKLIYDTGGKGQDYEELLWGDNTISLQRFKASIQSSPLPLDKLSNQSFDLPVKLKVKPEAKLDWFDCDNSVVDASSY
jgi:hypothetical protein